LVIFKTAGPLSAYRTKLTSTAGFTDKLRTSTSPTATAKSPAQTHILVRVVMRLTKATLPQGQFDRQAFLDRKGNRPKLNKPRLKAGANGGD